MAKRRRQTASGLEGKFHSLVSKVEAWKQQRAELAAAVREFIVSAEALLKDLGDTGKASAAKPARVLQAGPRSRRRFSREARAKMAAAMKKRWAEAKKAGKSKL
jgi:hypothetical protein